MIARVQAQDMYFSDAEMRDLVLALRECLAGAELVFDVVPPLAVWLQNLSLALIVPSRAWAGTG